MKKHHSLKGRKNSSELKNAVYDVIQSYRKKCNYLEVRVEESRETSISLNTGRVRSVDKCIDFGGNVRVFHKGGWGFNSFTELEHLNKAATAACEAAKYLGKNQKTGLAEVPVVNDNVPLQLVNDPTKVSLKNKVELLFHYNDLILGFGGPIKNCSLGYSDKHTTLLFANSDGSFIKQEKMDIMLTISIIATDNRGSETTVVSRGSSNDFNVVYGLEKEIEEGCRIASQLLKAPEARKGVYPVICDPKLSGVFVHEAFGHISESDTLCDNKKLQKIMQLGKRFGSEILNIYDSGLDEGSRGYLKYDDEGVRTEKTYLIKEGILTGRLHTRETAAKLKEKVTGNARALNFRFPPLCRMRNTCIEKGKSSLKDMIESIDDGLYAIDVHGGIGGEMFTFTAGYGYVIRKGKICELVKNIKLIGNLFNTLKDIDMIGNDYEIITSGGGCGKEGQFPLPVGFSSPHIRIRKLLVG